MLVPNGGWGEGEKSEVGSLTADGEIVSPTTGGNEFSHVGWRPMSWGLSGILVSSCFDIAAPALRPRWTRSDMLLVSLGGYITRVRLGWSRFGYQLP